MVRSLFCASLFLSLFVSAETWAVSCRKAKSPGVKTSLRNIQPSINTISGVEKGIPNRFCVFQSSSSVALVDPTTLESRRPSIAATYIKKGVNIAALEQIPDVQRSADRICDALAASPILMEIGGSYIGPHGPKAICVFGDGSKVGPDELVQSTKDPSYLGLRNAISAAPLTTDLPYLYQDPLTTTARDNLVNFTPYGPNPPTGLNFTWSGQISYTKGQPFNPATGVQIAPLFGGGVQIDVVVGRQNSYNPAQWFINNIQSQPIATGGVSFSTSLPSNLNFALTGTLIINGISYPIALGQGHAVNPIIFQSSNNWWLGGSTPGWVTGSYTCPPNVANCYNGTGIITPDSNFLISPGVGSNYLFWVYSCGPYCSTSKSTASNTD